jgi:hypothetical protein
MRIYVATFTEGDFDELHEHDDVRGACGFARGFTVGARAYGAGSCAAFVLPDEERDMRESQDDEAADEAMAAYVKAVSA